MNNWQSWVAAVAVLIIVWLFVGRGGAHGARVLRGPALWTGSSPSKGTQRNRRMRGRGTWGQEIRNLTWAEQRELRKERGTGSWSKKTANLYRAERRREREERRSRNLLHKLLG
jgi:hypothetical protein